MGEQPRPGAAPEADQYKVDMNSSIQPNMTPSYRFNIHFPDSLGAFIDGSCGHPKSLPTLPLVRLRIKDCAFTGPGYGRCSILAIRYANQLLYKKIMTNVSSAACSSVEDEGDDESAAVLMLHSNYVLYEASSYPYRPRTSAKMSISTMPTKIRDWRMYDRTPC
jgi:hypothetical protein